MNYFDRFAAGLPVNEFIAKYGTPPQQARWRQTFEAIQLNDARKTLLASFKREMNVLVLAGAWCGDCSGQCPIYDRCAEAAPVIKVRYIDRDEHADVQKDLQINGGNRVPVVLFFSEDGFEVARFGERTLSKYRQMMQEFGGAGCPTGLVRSGDPLLEQVTQDWLNEFERVQWMLRLSPRLRSKHGD
ncbi:MAG: thioredoxin family protein [Planctomycetes bacterium]|nr:thioredoxin family protein [Planctomycetota bacterium]